MNWRRVDFDILITAEEGYGRIEHESFVQSRLLL
jgi:hypothetical protein